MKRFSWHESWCPVPPESPREGAAGIHLLADVVRILEQAGDPEDEEATEERAWRSSRDHLSVVEDFADFLSPGSPEGGPGEPGRDFKERLRRRLWRLHVRMHGRRGRTH